METGLMLVSGPTGARYWYKAPPTAGPDWADTGYKEMESISWTYGAAWDHPKTTIHYGRVEGNTFTPLRDMRPDPVPPIPQAA